MRNSWRINSASIKENSIKCVRLARNNKHSRVRLYHSLWLRKKKSFNSGAGLHHPMLCIPSHNPLIRFHKLTRREISPPSHPTLPPCSCFNIPARLLFQRSQLARVAKLLIQSQNRVKHFFDVVEVDTL